MMYCTSLNVLGTPASYTRILFRITMFKFRGLLRDNSHWTITLVPCPCPCCAVKGMYRCSMHPHAGSPTDVYWDVRLHRHSHCVPVWHPCASGCVSVHRHGCHIGAQWLFVHAAVCPHLWDCWHWNAWNTCASPCWHGTALHGTCK